MSPAGQQTRRHPDPADTAGPGLQGTPTGVRRLQESGHQLQKTGEGELVTRVDQKCSYPRIFIYDKILIIHFRTMT